MKKLKCGLTIEQITKACDETRDRVSKMSREERAELGRKARLMVEEGRLLWNEWLREEGRDLFDKWLTKRAKKTKS